MNFSKPLDRDSLLTVKEAAALTNLAVPTFYTPRKKRELGYNPEAQPWLIPVQALIDLGLLTDDLQPTRGKKYYQNSQMDGDPIVHQREFEELKARVVDLEHQNALLTVMVEEKTRQIEMLTRILDRLPSTQEETKLSE
jgi:hypothetical protein